jgi:solute carrier family 13 (sodium-dependent dicarboxylate transporter), member 2/3/5
MSSPNQTEPESLSGRYRKTDLKILVKAAVIILLAALSTFIPFPGVSLAGRITLGIFVGAAGFWVSEVIPPFATAIAVVVLQVYFLGSDTIGADYRIFLNPIASPVIVLFFGGFILAGAATKHGLDLRLARYFLKPFGRRPFGILMGVISVTALFSMFMSNTATTVMMISIIQPLVGRMEKSNPFRKGLILSVPFAANIGGMGTLIGSPPNAVAASVLSQMGTPISFIDWMKIGTPLVVVMIFALGLLLSFQFRSSSKEIDTPEFLLGPVTRELVIVVVTFATTVTLWMTEPLHQIPSPVVALIPIMVFTMFGVIGAEDLKRIEWDVLILVAGGLSLGVAMQSSGLADSLVRSIPFDRFGSTVILITIAITTVGISNFMSNTSASNMLIPIVVAISAITPTVAAMAVALSATLAMSLPISTPPNSIAYATKQINTRDMMISGTVVSVIGITLVTLALHYFKN